MVRAMLCGPHCSPATHCQDSSRLKPSSLDADAMWKVEEWEGAPTWSETVKARNVLSLCEPSRSLLSSPRAPHATIPQASASSRSRAQIVLLPLQPDVVVCAAATTLLALDLLVVVVVVALKCDVGSHSVAVVVVVVVVPSANGGGGRWHPNSRLV